MVNFNFTLDDSDTETLFSALHAEVCKCHEGILERLALGYKLEDDQYIKWYKNRIKYIEELKLKITGDRIPEEEVEERIEQLLLDFYKIPRYDTKQHKEWIQRHMIIKGD